MNKITVWPRIVFYNEMKAAGINDDTVDSFSGYAFISIQSSKVLAPAEKPYFQKQHSNALTITFDDITNNDTEVLTQYSDCHLFTDQDAKTIYDFVKKNIGKHFIIHCTAGISRSGAVGEFIQRVTESSYSEFVRHNPNIHPNSFVLLKLIRACDPDDLVY